MANSEQGSSRRDFLRWAGEAFAGGTAVALGLGKARAQDGIRPTPTRPLVKENGVAIAQDGTPVANENLPAESELHGEHLYAQEIDALPLNYGFRCTLKFVELGNVIVGNESLEIHILGVCDSTDASGQDHEIAIVLGANNRPENQAFLIGLGYANSGVFESKAYETMSNQVSVHEGDSLIVTLSPNSQVIGPDNKFVLNAAIADLYGNREANQFILDGSVANLPRITFNGKTYPLILSSDASAV